MKYLALLILAAASAAAQQCTTYIFIPPANVPQCVQILTPQTGTQIPNVGITGDPVATYNGELFQHDRMPDLSLGGPLPLEFKRLYANNWTGASLGPGWTHIFDLGGGVGTTAVVNLAGGRTIRFNRVGNAWERGILERLLYQLIDVQGGGYQLLDPETNLIYSFNAAMQLIKVEDRNGNAHTLTRGASGPTEISDGLGRLLKFTYDTTRLMKVEDQTGRAVNFTFAGNNLATSTSTHGKLTTYAYTTIASRTLLTGETLPAGNAPTTTQYDGTGRAIRQTDAKGAQTNLAFNTPSNGLTSITDATGAIIQHAHAEPGSLIRAIDPAGKEVGYTYDARDRLTRITDRLGRQTNITYHEPSGYPASVTDPAGKTTGFVYTAQTQGAFTHHVLTRINYPDGSFESREYDTRGNVTKITDRTGKIWTYTYNARGQWLTAVVPDAGTWTVTYNADGTQATVTTPAGNQTAFQYDALKRPATVTYPGGLTRQFTYDAADQVLTITDEGGNTTTFAYDDNGRRTTATNARGEIVRYSYDANNNLISIQDPTGRNYPVTRDALGRIGAVANPAGDTLTNTFDPRGRLTSIKDATGTRTSFAYNDEGDLTGIADGLTNQWNLTLDAARNLTRLTSPTGAVTQLGYDTMNRVTSITDPRSETTQVTYDAQGRLKTAALPEGITGSFSYTGSGQIASATGPNGSAWTRTYDSSARLTVETDPLARTVSYAYDNRQRISQITLPGGSATVTYNNRGDRTRILYSDSTDLAFTYDAVGRPLTAGSATLGYDANGRITQSNGIQIARDTAGRIASITYAQGKAVTYEYNVRGLLTKVRDWLNGTTELTYDAALRLASMKRPNNVTTNYAYSAEGRLTGITDAGGPFASTLTLSYDAAGNLTGVNRAAPSTVSFGPSTSIFAFDAAHQVTGIGYDGLGRATTDGQRAYQWDLASRLKQYQNGGITTALAYDAFGFLTSGAKNYVWNMALGRPSIAIERTGPNDAAYYVYSPGGDLLYRINADTGARNFYHFDEAGNTAFLSADTGIVTDTYSITPFGESVSHSGLSTQPFTFRGREGVLQMGGGLFYMRARFYDARTGRFLSRDPIPSLDPRAMNPYQYAFANPLSFSDPSGLAVSGSLKTAMDLKAVQAYLDSTATEKFDYFVPIGSTKIRGLADRGTRLMARFASIPSGVADYLSVLPDTDLSRQGLGGETLSHGPYESRVSPIPLNNGSASAVWETMNADPLSSQTYEFGVGASFAANTSSNLPGLATYPFRHHGQPAGGIFIFWPPVPIDGDFQIDIPQPSTGGTCSAPAGQCILQYANTQTVVI